MEPAKTDDSDEFGVELEWNDERRPVSTEGSADGDDDIVPADESTEPEVMTTAEQEDDDAVMPTNAGAPETGDDGAATDDDATNAPSRSAAAGPLLPAVVGRLETVHSSITTIGMRIDVLGQSTASLRSAIGDQLSEYSETVGQLVRSQAEALDDYRHGNERSLGELRRTLTLSAEAIRTLSARVDELVRDSASLVAAVRALDNVERHADRPVVADPNLEALRAEMSGLGRELAEGRAEFAKSPSDDGAITRLQAAVDALADDLPSSVSSLNIAVDALANDLPSSVSSLNIAVDALANDLPSSVSSLTTAVDALANDLPGSLSNIAVGLHHDLAAQVRAAVDELHRELEAIAAEVAAAPEAAPPPAAVAELAHFGEELSSELVALRTEVVLLKRRIGVRGRPAPSPGLDDSLVAELAERIAESLPAPQLSEGDITRIVEALAAHLDRTFEVVSEEPVLPAATEPSANDNPAPAPRRRR